MTHGHPQRLALTLLALGLGLGLGIAACNRADSLSPAVPEAADGLSAPPGILVEEQSPDGLLTGQGALGLYKFTLDPATLEATLAPVARTGAALGDHYAVDVTGFLAGAVCTDCFRVQGVGQTPDHYVYVDYRIQHPFPLPANDPAGPNDRLDLHVFDLRGIFLKEDPTDARYSAQFLGFSDGSTGPQNMTVDNSGFLAGIELDGVTGAFDEYTDSFFPTEATAHPFIIMHEDHRPSNFNNGHPNGFEDLRDPMGYNVFPQGGGPYVKRVTYTTKPGDQVEYLIVLTANFVISSTGRGNALGQRGNPAYYLPWSNAKTPWRVRVSETDNKLTNDNPDSEAVFDLEIYDWQHAIGSLTLVPEFRVENQARNSMLRTSRVSNVRVQVPGVADEGDVVLESLGGGGDLEDPIRFTVRIPNAQLGDSGSYLGCVRIEDDYDPVSEGGEGLTRELSPFVIRDYSAFATFSVEVADGDGDPIGTMEGNGVYNFQEEAERATEIITFDGNPANNFAFFDNGFTKRAYAVGEASGFDGTQGIDVALASSMDGGLTWEESKFLPPSLAGRLGDQLQPALTVSSSNVLHLVWTQKGPDGSADIYYSRSADSGTLWSDPVTLNAQNEVDTSEPGQQSNPDIKSSRFAPNVVSVVFEQKLGGYGIGIAHSFDGGVTWDFNEAVDHTPNTLSSARRLNPTIHFAPLSTGMPNVVGMVWERQFTGPGDVAGMLSNTGTAGLAGTGKLASNESALRDATKPNAIVTDTGTGPQLLVVYNDQLRAVVANPFGGQPITVVIDSELRAARLAEGASAFQPSVLISDISDVTAVDLPSLAVRGTAPASPIVVVWSDDRNRFTSGHDIFAAISTSNGTTWGNDFSLIARSGHQRYPAASTTAGGKLRLVYRDESIEGRASIQVVTEP